MNDFLTLEQYIAAHPNPQAGPCAGCGATSYPLSMGGPGICPACDSIPPERRVKQLAEENRRLTLRVTSPPKFDCLRCGAETYNPSCVCGACVDGEPTVWTYLGKDGGM